MAEKPADPAGAAGRGGPAAEGALAQPTVELNVLGGRVAAGGYDEPTAEQPIVRRPGGPPQRQGGPEDRAADGLNEPTVEQPVVRPRSAPAANRSASPAPAAASADPPPAPQPAPPAPQPVPEPEPVGVTTAAAPTPAPAPAPAGASSRPMPTAPPDEPDRFIAVVRRYGWVAAAGAVATVVLLCSAPFVSGSGLTWTPADSSLTPSPPVPTVSESAPPPTPQTTEVSPAAGAGRDGEPAAPAGDPQGVARPPSSAAPPVAPTLVPTPPPTSAAPPAAAPVRLGPDSDDDLRRMLDDYCKQRFGGPWMAWPRSWPGSGNDWECVRPWTSDDRDLDVGQACVTRYGEPAYAEAGDRRDPFSWRCYRR
ncbi:hypothetical protein O7623_02080 [Solwaraspora sp. WMMD791]|uniref:hypothetical protein n=1 Tax=Solwaraspora sp. WMMD791 TaxID=3016086 RepID=UPI00249C8670|nr:hypothetical protein [Solwaraspora sp. WMMD791]WFE28019.1 hypothetical protein O7623_02080 [Solwaraspora sp. WMMD791]